ncbi:tRNA uridine-5-carboxymethylaminomethyl(34) synthesis GTPase MnmE [Aestuariibius insulae]|uniref:tRNA uridine-5-carboxymethylaminomethyl(34) synthesis GTPase MnmE n=1 Tax=Aestuariibius insulae TaxID=2058287 RepID=UPI00345E8F81
MTTIFAQATAPGKAGVSIIRVSGPAAFHAAEMITGHKPRSRAMSLRSFRRSDGELIDRGLLLSFPGPDSFTGEDSVEFHCHGSAAVIKDLLRELDRIEDLQPADPGEFTRRALQNDKLDLVQVEALGDLIDAETDLQRRQAMSLLSGVLSEKIESWRAILIKALSLLEATIDFSDEDVPAEVWKDAGDLVQSVRLEISNILSNSMSSDRLRQGYSVVILGPPNAGKSTLINALSDRDVAITTPIPGTTRDIVETALNWHGIPIRLMDTAGLRKSDDEIEILGVEKAIAAAEMADLRIYLGEQPDNMVLPSRAQDLIVGAKADLGRSHGLSVSGLTGEGLAELREAVAQRLEVGKLSKQLLLRDRYRNVLSEASENLGAAQEAIENRLNEELVSEEIRAALFVLDMLIGRVTPDDVLDDVFSSFCIGK